MTELDLPVLLFWGDLDQFLLPETAKRAAARLQRNRLVIFENCGHFPYLDRRDEFARMVIHWVKEGHTRIEQLLFVHPLISGQIRQLIKAAVAATSDVATAHGRTGS